MSAFVGLGPIPIMPRTRVHSVSHCCWMPLIEGGKTNVRGFIVGIYKYMDEFVNMIKFQLN